MELYRSFATWLRQEYGERVQKISINLPFSCPNKDGNKGTGGCVYCDNQSFLPDYTLESKTVIEQLKEGIQYFKKKYPTQRYIAYFQNYTNTYAPTEKLFQLFSEAMSFPEVIAISVSTRPDCLSDKVISLLSELNKIKRVFVEIGIESTYDTTLTTINRCHTYSDVVKAISRLNNVKILVSGHLIFGLPGETIADAIVHAQQLSLLPLHSIKIHQLQILKDTPLHRLYMKNNAFVTPLSLHEHINWCIHFLEHLSPNIYIERFTSESPKEKVIAPNWNQIKNYQVVELIKKELKQKKLIKGKNTFRIIDDI